MFVCFSCVAALRDKRDGVPANNKGLRARLLSKPGGEALLFACGFHPQALAPAAAAADDADAADPAAEAEARKSVWVWEDEAAPGFWTALPKEERSVLFERLCAPAETEQALIHAEVCCCHPPPVCVCTASRPEGGRRGQAELHRARSLPPRPCVVQLSLPMYVLCTSVPSLTALTMSPTRAQVLAQIDAQRRGGAPAGPEPSPRQEDAKPGSPTGRAWGGHVPRLHVDFESLLRNRCCGGTVEYLVVADITDQDQTGQDQVVEGVKVPKPAAPGAAESPSPPPALFVLCSRPLRLSRPRCATPSPVYDSALTMPGMCLRAYDARCVPRGGHVPGRRRARGAAAAPHPHAHRRAILRAALRGRRRARPVRTNTIARLGLRSAALNAIRECLRDGIAALRGAKSGRRLTAGLGA